MRKPIAGSILAATITLAFVGAAAGEPGHFCGTEVHSGEATGKSESEATSAAKVWWSSRAGAMGEGYQLWDNAKDKSVKCHPGPRDSIKCVAAAKPCLKAGVIPKDAPKQDL